MSFNPFQILGTLVSGAAEGNAADYNASINAMNAGATRSEGAAAVERQRREGQRALGSIRANYAASGITMDGSPMDVFAASAAEAELDARNLSYSYEMKARGYDAEASLQRARATNVRTGAAFSAASQLAGSPFGQSTVNNWGSSGSTGEDPRYAVRGSRGY